MSYKRQHLFISYAAEDIELAQWLARKLAARGHPVWFDQIKLLGGEQWPQTIDDAIKNQTFRMLALISENSLKKQKPTGERALAQNIAEKYGPADFLIPIKIDNSELDWLTANVSNISFNISITDGWRALLKKLDSISAPRTLENAATLAASSFPRGDDLINKHSEQLVSNIIRVKSFPGVLNVFQVVHDIDDEIKKQIKNNWIYYELNHNIAVSLMPPPSEFAQYIGEPIEQMVWADCEMLRHARARDIAANLIMKTLAKRLVNAGCLEHQNSKLKNTFYLPENFTEDGKLSFQGFRAKKTWLQIRGKVTFKQASGVREQNFHHFGFSLKLARGLDKNFHIQIIPIIVFFDNLGNAITDKSVGSRRKRMTKYWYNDKWLNRIMAAKHILVNLPSAGEGDLKLEPELVTLLAPYGLNEAILEPEGSEEDMSTDLLEQELDIEELNEDINDE